MSYSLLRKTERALKLLLHLFIAAFIRRKPADLEKLEPKKVKRILIIRQHNEIGDLILASPAVRAFKKHFPRAKLHMIVRPKLEAVARGCKSLSKVIVFDKKKYWRKPWLYYAFFKGIWKKYDIAVVLSSVSVSTTSTLFAWLSRAPRCVGRVEGDIHSSPALRTLFNVVVSRGDKQACQVEKNLDFLRALLPESEEEDLCYEYKVPKGATNWAAGFLRRKKRQKLLRYRKLVFVHPGAGKLANRWPDKYYAALADRLIVRGCTVLVDISPGDEDAVDKMLYAMQRKAVIVPMVNLSRLAGLISRCHLFIGNDTGILHLAAATGTKTIGLFGPTDPAQWKPPGKSNLALRGAGGELSRLSVDEVARVAMRELLKNS